MTQDEALALLKTGASIFLTGQPASGKTHTVNRYLRELQRQGVRYAIPPRPASPPLTGYGVTIHAWSGIRRARNAQTAAISTLLAANRRLAARIEKTEVLIIDEIRCCRRAP
jgi:DNA replication protein DnaC